MFKLSTLALVLASAFTCHSAFAVTTGCTDTSGQNVLLGSTDSGVPNRVVDLACNNIDGLILDELLNEPDEDEEETASYALH